MTTTSARPGEPSPTPPAGLLLAAGAGSRLGQPKALVTDELDRAWVQRGVARLLEAGCSPVAVVLGAAAHQAVALLPDDPRVLVVIAEDWADGQSASIAAGLHALVATAADQALITLVDLPALPVAAVTRVAHGARMPPAGVDGETAASALRQATYGGRPGHPVLIGRAHWAGVIDSLRGDHGARGYLVEHGADEVECGDLWDGQDVDTLDS